MPLEWAIDAEKRKNYDQQITNIAKTQISETINFISYFQNNVFLI